MPNESSLGIGIVLLGGSVLLMVLIVGGIIGLIWVISRKHREFYAKIRAMPFSPISQLRDGDFVKIRGVVRCAEDRLRNPFSGEPCVAYSVSMAVRTEETGGARRNWGFSKIASEDGQVDFFVDDGTGMARISGKLAMTALDFKVPADSPSTFEFLRAKGVAVPDAPIFPSGKLVCEGMELIVVGVARSVARGGAFRSGDAEVIIEPLRDRPILVTDDNEAFVSRKTAPQDQKSFGT